MIAIQTNWKIEPCFKTYPYETATESRDFLNLKGLSLSGQLSVLSFCPFVVLHGQSSQVVMYPQKNHGKNL